MNDGDGEMDILCVETKNILSQNIFINISFYLWNSQEEKNIFFLYKTYSNEKKFWPKNLKQCFFLGGGRVEKVNALLEKIG